MKNEKTKQERFARTSRMFAGSDELKTSALYRGTRILAGDMIRDRRAMYNGFVEILESEGFMEIELPSVEYLKTYVDKAGDEVMNQTYNFSDKSDREICLRPEGTATCQQLANAYQSNKDFAVFYMSRCWRYERPQAGRYREFTQFGVEILNPRENYYDYLVDLSDKMLSMILPEGTFDLNQGVKRGLSYYTDGEGWEGVCPALGAQKQVLGGGSYAEGIGFAIGVDRVLLAKRKYDQVGDRK